MRVNCVVLFFAQMVFFGASMFYVKRAFDSVSRTTTSNFPMSYLVIRFGATFFSQLYGLFPIQVSNVFQQYPNVVNNAIFIRLVSVTRLSGPILDALVLILGNADFIEWVKAQYRTMFGSSVAISQRSSSTHGIEMSPKSEISPIEEQMEKTHLSTSIGKIGRSLPPHLSFVVQVDETQESDLSDGISTARQNE
eukprot:Phypoly_transcript_22983.p1 GENE.Phypoly_transcript_22983~~Phypoly_transcript_22983.p1  ORF type:complete len:194 (+),score=4.20 Phypoly_transcript_22983:2-583(+)